MGRILALLALHRLRRSRGPRRTGAGSSSPWQTGSNCPFFARGGGLELLAPGGASVGALPPVPSGRPGSRAVAPILPLCFDPASRTKANRWRLGSTDRRGDMKRAGDRAGRAAGGGGGPPGLARLAAGGTTPRRGSSGW
ncbi:MAG: hypothetical protein M0C28_41030 [Candidatus Moduliflexus flocculans]|nr:hypothetical protein [Candidatus Moduliflexus flocculans]